MVEDVMRYDTEHKQRTHEKVVQEAANAIRQHGPDKIGIASLMSKLGLTHGGFYAHFNSKDDLVAEAISHMFEDRMEAFRKCLAGAEPAEGLASYIDLYLSIRHRDRRDKGCPVASLASDIARMPLVARKRFEVGIQHLTDAFTDVLKILDKPQPEILAASVVAEMVGAMTIARAITNSDLSERILDTARRNVKERVGLANT
jgi:TetR/AcrR family transcriptional repressor of nem operon